MSQENPNQNLRLIFLLGEDNQYRLYFYSCMNPPEVKPSSLCQGCILRQPNNTGVTCDGFTAHSGLIYATFESDPPQSFSKVPETLEKQQPPCFVHIIHRQNLKF